MASACTGPARASQHSAYTLLRPRGVILQLGMGGDMSLPMMSITAKELELRGSFRFHSEFAVGVDLMRKGLIDVKPLITDRYAFVDSVEAFDFAKAMPPASVKVQIEMPR